MQSSMYIHYYMHYALTTCNMCHYSQLEYVQHLPAAQGWRWICLHGLQRREPHGLTSYNDAIKTALSYTGYYICITVLQCFTFYCDVKGAFYQDPDSTWLHVCIVCLPIIITMDPYDAVSVILLCCATWLPYCAFLHNYHSASILNFVCYWLATKERLYRKIITELQSDNQFNRGLIQSYTGLFEKLYPSCAEYLRLILQADLLITRCEDYN